MADIRLIIDELDSMVSNGRLADGMALADRAIADAPSEYQLSRWKVMALIENAPPSYGVAAARRLEGAFPDEPCDTQTVLAYAYLRAGEPNSALSRLDIAESVAGPNQAITRLRAEALCHLGHRSEAADLIRALGDGPFELDGLRARKFIEPPEGEAEMRSLESELLRAGENRPSTGSWVAQWYEKNGQIERSSAEYSALLLKYPDDQTVLLEAALFFIRRGRDDVALELLHKGFATNPANLKISAELSSVYRRRRQWVRGIKVLLQSSKAHAKAVRVK